jgi:hypothetical protein
MSKRKEITESEFTFRSHSSGKKEIIAEHQVPRNSIYQIENGTVIEATINSIKTQSISSNSTETINLGNAAIVEYMPSVAQESDLRDDSDLVVFDSNGTRLDNSGDYNLDSVNTSEDLYNSVDIQNTTGTDEEISVHFVQTKGTVEFTKQTAGRGSRFDVLQEESALNLAFSNPDDPESDKQIRFDGIGDTEGLIPEKFKLQMRFYARNSEADMENAENIRILLPVQSQKLDQLDVDKDELKREIREQMG